MRYKTRTSLCLLLGLMMTGCAGEPPPGLSSPTTTDSDTTNTTVPVTPITTLTMFDEELGLDETPRDGLPNRFPEELLPPGLISSTWIPEGAGETTDLQSSESYDAVVEFYTDLLGEPSFASAEDDSDKKTFWFEASRLSFQVTVGVFDRDPVDIRVTGLF